MKLNYKIMITVFGKEWFKKYNKNLCWLANSFIGNWVFKFTKFGHDLEKYGKITEIHPNAITHKQRVLYDFEKRETKQEYTTQFFSRNEYALRLQKVFMPIWLTFHIWDIITKPMPQLNLGFDTLEVNPGSIGTNNPVDGFISGYTGADNVTWATIRNSDGSSGSFGYTSGNSIIQIQAGSSSGWIDMFRSIYCFDTSSIDDAAEISATTMSIYGTSKADGNSISPTINIYTSTPTSTSSLVKTDFPNIGTTAQCDTAVTYANWSTTGAYSDFDFNATGIGNISKTAISKFGVRMANYDPLDVEPSRINSQQSYLRANFAASASNKPKLVVTYTVASTDTGFFNVF